MCWYAGVTFPCSSGRNNGDIGSLISGSRRVFALSWEAGFILVAAWLLFFSSPGLCILGLGCLWGDWDACHESLRAVSLNELLAVRSTHC